MAQPGERKSLVERTLALGGAAALISIFLFLSMGFTDTVPDNAVVFLDETSNIYYSPPLLADDSRQFAIAANPEWARDRGYYRGDTALLQESPFVDSTGQPIVFVDRASHRFFVVPPAGAIAVTPVLRGALKSEPVEPDSRHREAGGFVDNYGAVAFVMRKLGLSEGRWSPSGEWRW